MTNLNLKKEHVLNLIDVIKGNTNTAEVEKAADELKTYIEVAETWRDNYMQVLIDNELLSKENRAFATTIHEQELQNEQTQKDYKVLLDRIVRLEEHLHTTN